MSSISINNCVFMGRLTGEPEMRYTRSNKPVTTFRIAVSRRSSADVTDFIPCVTYGAQAEFVSQWFQKGTLAIVIGQLTSHMWTDKNTGKTRVDYEIQCDNVQFGETKKHVFNEKNLPPLHKGDILLHGHTHVPKCVAHENYIYMNPGSVSIPKENSYHGYMTWEGSDFVWKDLEGGVRNEVIV